MLFVGEVSTRVLRDWVTAGTYELGAAHTKGRDESGVNRRAERQHEVVCHRTRN